MCSQCVLEEKSKKVRKNAVSKDLGLSDMTRFLGCEGSCLVFKELLVFRIRGECRVGLLNYKIKLDGTFLMTGNKSGSPWRMPIITC